MINMFNRFWNIGEYVHVEGKEGKFKIKNIHITRKWVELEGLVGYFQRGHVKKCR